MGHDRIRPVREAGMVHAERRQNPSVGELGEGHARDPRHDQAQQDIVGVAVHPLRTGREVELALAADSVQQVLSVHDVFVAPAREVQQHLGIAQTAGLVDEVSDRDRLAEVRKLRHVPVNVVVQRELAVLDEQLNREGGDLLGHRSGVEDGVRRVRDPLLEIGHAVPASEHGSSIEAGAD